MDLPTAKRLLAQDRAQHGLFLTANPLSAQQLLVLDVNEATNLLLKLAGGPYAEHPVTLDIMDEFRELRRFLVKEAMFCLIMNMPIVRRWKSLTAPLDRRYRTMEAASMRLQKEAKGYLDSLRGRFTPPLRKCILIRPSDDRFSNAYR
jgi:hypothetical protein